MLPTKYRNRSKNFPQIIVRSDVSLNDKEVHIIVHVCQPVSAATEHPKHESESTNGALRRGRAAAGQNEARLRSDDRGRPLVGAVCGTSGAHVEQTARLRRSDAGDNSDFHARLFGAR